MTSAFADSMFMAGHSIHCPGCSRADLDLLVSHGGIAEEIELRRKFFLNRIEGALAPAERKDTFDVAHGRPGEIALCPSCGILVRREAEAPRFEEDRYQRFVLERMLRAHIDAFRKKETLYRPLLPPAARVLEIGSYSGGFLHVATEWGWDATGVDVGADTSRFTRAHGLRTCAGGVETCGFDRSSFDAVFIWNCFEQLPEPGEMAREAKRLLRPGGLLVIRTPNAELYEICERLLAFRRRVAPPPDDHDPLVILLGHANLLAFPHLFGFSGEALDRLVSARGFRAVRRVGDRHMDPGIRPLTATALREADRAATIMRMIPPWIEALYRA